MCLWGGEVSTRRTQREVQEMVSAKSPLPARLEFVITDIHTSFLASFRHRDLSRVVITERLLVEVSTETLNYAFHIFYI